LGCFESNKARICIDTLEVFLCTCLYSVEAVAAVCMRTIGGCVHHPVQYYSTVNAFGGGTHAFAYADASSCQLQWVCTVDWLRVSMCDLDSIWFVIRRVLYLEACATPAQQLRSCMPCSLAGMQVLACFGGRMCVASSLLLPC
jgi:hypothetical protein